MSDIMVNINIAIKLDMHSTDILHITIPNITINISC